MSVIKGDRGVINSQDILSEYYSNLPEHYEDMPAQSSNGVTRNEMEWKAIAIAMAKEIAKLRSEK